MRTIGLIGLGNAGRPVAERLLQKGYLLKVYDLNPSAAEPLIHLGALNARSARDATSEITITILPSSVEVRAAASGAAGILSGIQPGYTLIDLSGTDPDCARELEEKVKEKSGHFLGGTLHADGAPAVTISRGLLSIVIGGERRPLEACSPILKDLAQNVICVPQPWMPKALKIAVIMLAAANNVINAEVSAWLLAQGIDPRFFHDILQMTGSRAGASRLEQFLRRNNAHGGALSNSYKDILQALKVAAEKNTPLPLTSMVHQIQEMARAQGLKRLNSPAAIAKLYELLAGIDFSGAQLDGEKAFPEPHEPQIFFLGSLRSD